MSIQHDIESSGSAAVIAGRVKRPHRQLRQWTNVDECLNEADTRKVVDPK